MRKDLLLLSSASLALLAACGEGGTDSVESGVGAASQCWEEIPRALAESLAGGTMAESTATVASGARICQRTQTLEGRFLQWGWYGSTTTFSTQVSNLERGETGSLADGWTCSKVSNSGYALWYSWELAEVGGLSALHVAGADSACGETGTVRQTWAICDGKTLQAFAYSPSWSDSLVWAKGDTLLAQACSAGS